MKKLLYILIIIISIYIINNLIRSIYNLWQKQDLVTQAREELQKEKNTNAKLKDQLVQVKRPDFIEEEARNKLFMVREGESIVLVPSISTPSKTHSVKKQQKYHWEEWIKFFFGADHR
jgi:cell division protein FtsB